MSHFDIAELTFTGTGIENTPDEEAKANLNKLSQVLEAVRCYLGDHPLIIHSAYRSPAVNAAVGGSCHSAHLEGLAADFTCPEFGIPLKICLAIIDSGIKFDQIILEKSWVHFSIDKPMRKQVLTCVAPKKYIPGLHEVRSC